MFKVKEMRERAGMTQKQLAGALGISQQSVYYYESGDRDIKGSLLIQMSEVMKCSVSDILGITDPDVLQLVSDDESGGTSQRIITRDDKETEVILNLRKCSPKWVNFILNASRAATNSTTLSDRGAARAVESYKKSRDLESRFVLIKEQLLSDKDDGHPVAEKPSKKISAIKDSNVALLPEKVE